MTEYRDRVYERYATVFKGKSQPVSDARAARLSATYGRYLRGWLPADKGAAICDLGCGSGEFLRFFVDLGYSDVCGVDRSPEQAALARQVHSNVHEADVFEFLCDMAGRFDLITAIDIVEHLTKDEVLAFLDACNTALRPGGRVIIQTPNGESPMCGWIQYGDFTHETILNAQSLRLLTRLCGFSEFEARETGPVPLGLFSCVRWALWRLARLKLKLFNLVETGSAGSGVFTRVFAASAVKGASGTP